jgi:hypothetical protein
MNSWIATPALGLGVAAILAFSTPPGGHRMMSSPASCVRAAAVDFTVPEGICLFSVDAKSVKSCTTHAALREAKADETMIWPLGIIELTAGAAVGAWQVTFDFLGSLYDYAEEKGGDLI